MPAEEEIFHNGEMRFGFSSNRPRLPTPSPTKAAGERQPEIFVQQHQEFLELRFGYL
jgi:hypothetical protein